MADTQREGRSKEESRGKTDVPRTPETQQEVQRSRGTSGRGELARRGSFDVGRDPFAMLTSFRREMDRLFDEFGFGGNLLKDFGRNVWSPQVEISERDGKLHVSADLPGLGKDDVRVEVLDNNLTIQGERRTEQRDEREGWSERSYGRFFRSIPLPDGINPDSAKASFENGVLDITFDAPKLADRRGKQIQIGAGAASTTK